MSECIEVDVEPSSPKKVFLAYDPKRDQVLILVDLPVPPAAFETLATYELRSGQRYKDLYQYIMNSGVIDRARRRRSGELSTEDMENQHDEDVPVTVPIDWTGETQQRRRKEANVMPPSDRVLRSR